MPPKRAGGTLTSKKAKKVPKLIDQQVENNTDMKKTSTSQIQELERLLEKNICDSHVLDLVQKIYKTSDLPSNLAIRILEFCIKVENENLAREIINHQPIVLKTPEGGDVLWQAVNAANTAMALLLIRAGADLSFRDPENDCTILHQVLKSNKIKHNAKRKELACLIMNCGADINACDSWGRSVLNVAIKHNPCSSQLVEELLKRGANVTFGGESFFDDLCLAADNKPDLLLKLIEHQVTNEETKQKRCIFALDGLIRAKPNTIVLRTMKKILDLGVPVNEFYVREERYMDDPCSLLTTALFRKKKDAVKLLLNYGADPHEKNEDGETPLFQAAELMFTNASRRLIERGASIHAPNDDHQYPIHGACMKGSLRNLHLLLNLGADLNVTDCTGRTPFSYTGGYWSCTEAQSLLIKHFALIIAKGGTINDKDMASANQYVFKKCTQQLKRMKVEQIYDDVSYFSLFSENMYKMLRLMRNPAFARNFKQNSKKRAVMFPKYSYMLLHSFEIAEMRYKIWVEEKKHVQEGFGGTMPDLIVEKIAHYLCFEKLKRCEHDYYMSLHATLKNTLADKAKIL